MRISTYASGEGDNETSDIEDEEEDDEDDHDDDFLFRRENDAAPLQKSIHLGVFEVGFVDGIRRDALGGGDKEVEKRVDRRWKKSMRSVPAMEILESPIINTGFPARQGKAGR